MISRNLLISLMSVACAVSMAQPNSSAINAGAVMEVLGPGYEKPGAIGPAQSRIVVYRLDSNTLPGATSVLVNGGYHTSLIQDAYSELCYEPGNVELGARQMQVAQRSTDLPDTITVMRLNPAQTHYLRVRNQSGRPVLEPVAAEQAERELPGRRLQQHTISRVAKECVITAPASDLVKPATVPSLSSPTKPARHILAADSLTGALSSTSSAYPAESNMHRH